MKKDEFLDALRVKLSGMSKDDLEDRLDFYEEMIDDKIDEGYSEEDAVASIGTADEIADQILTETSFTKAAKEKIKPKRKLETWEIILLIVGAPLWVPLLVSVISVIVSLYVALWSIIISLWAVFGSMVVCAPAAVIMAVSSFTSGNVAIGFAFFGASMLFAGLSILLFFASRASSSGAVSLLKWMILCIKKLFVRGGTENE